MKGSQLFQETIKNHLDKMAVEDTLFCQHYNKDGKTIEKCCEYIMGEVSAYGCCGFDDEEIFGMAVHYFVEDNVEMKENKVSRVVVNHHVELSEQEKAEAREKAIKAYQNEVREGMKRKPVAKQKEEKVEPQLDLFWEGGLE